MNIDTGIILKFLHEYYGGGKKLDMHGIACVLDISVESTSLPLIHFPILQQ